MNHRSVFLTQKLIQWPGSNWRPSTCEADIIATRPQVPCCLNTSASVIAAVPLPMDCKAQDEPAKLDPSITAFLSWIIALSMPVMSVARWIASEPQSSAVVHP